MWIPNLIAKNRWWDNWGKWINKFSYYSFFSTGAYGPKKINIYINIDKDSIDEKIFSMDELNNIIKQMLKHPYIIDIDEKMHLVTLSNISHGITRKKGLEVENIGPRENGGKTYFYGPVKFKPSSIEDWLKLKKLISNDKEFCFNNELKIEIFEILVKKTRTIAWEPIEVSLKKIDNIIFRKIQILSISENQDLLDLINSRED